jgi:hypothetical protein
MFDIPILALLAASFAGLLAFVHLCEALTRRDAAAERRL